MISEIKVLSEAAHSVQAAIVTLNDATDESCHLAKDNNDEVAFPQNVLDEGSIDDQVIYHICL